MFLDALNSKRFEVEAEFKCFRDIPHLFFFKSYFWFNSYYNVNWRISNWLIWPSCIGKAILPTRLATQSSSFWETELFLENHFSDNVKRVKLKTI